MNFQMTGTHNYTQLHVLLLPVGLIFGENLSFSLLPSGIFLCGSYRMANGFLQLLVALETSSLGRWPSTSQRVIESCPVHAAGIFFFFLSEALDVRTGLEEGW